MPTDERFSIVPNELRSVLVEQWSAISSDRWETLVLQFPDAGRPLIMQLAAEERFSLKSRSVRTLTPELLNALYCRAFDEMVVQLDGKNWLLLAEIGKGAQGTVWIACPCDPKASAEQVVAIKVPKPNLPPNAMEYFQREEEILRRVDSTHIPKVVAFDKDRGLLAMEFIDGKPLNQLLKVAHRVSFSKTISIGIDICHALEVLHKENWIHKDVKPGNTILSEDGTASLIDFGLAEKPSNKLKTAGTPYYIAPEVFFPESKPDARADVYSLAASLYCLLSGYPPYFHYCLKTDRHNTSLADLDALTFRLSDSTAECDLSDVRQGIPRRLRRLLIACLSADPNDRPATAEELRSKLEDLQETLEKAQEIERELWALCDLLRRHIISVSSDVTYVGKQDQNALAIQEDLDKALAKFKALQSLRADPDTWADIEVAHHAVTHTVKVIERLIAMSRHISSFLNVEEVRTKAEAEKRNHLLRSLVDRTVEGIRSTYVQAVAAAHEWRDVLDQLDRESA